jgi:hypothetical protein
LMSRTTGSGKPDRSTVGGVVGSPCSLAMSV